MKGRLTVLALMVALTTCGVIVFSPFAAEARGRADAEPLTFDRLVATEGDMRLLASESGRAFSKYLFRYTVQGEEPVTGLIDKTDPQAPVTILDTGNGLAVTVNRDLAKRLSLDSPSGRVPYTGGGLFEGRVAVFPGTYVPVPFSPRWAPQGSFLVIAQGGRLDGVLQATANPVDRLVAYMQVKERLEKTRFTMIGKFTTVPELRALVKLKNIKGEPFVVRVDGEPFFALVALQQEDRT
jgi:hypothetical protein